MSRLHLGVPMMALALLACGGSVVFEEGGAGGDGGSGGASVTTTSSQSGTTTASSSGVTTGSTTSTSNGGGSSVSVTAVSAVSVGPGAGGGSACGSLSYAECLGDSGRCVPVFDDFCCPSCFPGGCSDCQDFRGVACIDRQTGGGTPPPGPPPQACPTNGCGFVPDWACNAQTPDCSGGCFGQPGCVEKLRCQGDGCELTCDAVAPDACSATSCDAPPPQCGDGTVPEVANGCWTGFCIPGWVCQFPNL